MEMQMQEMEVTTVAQNLIEGKRTMGNAELIGLEKTVLMCPFHVPDEAFRQVRQWIDTLDKEQACIVCGNSTGLERYALRILLSRGFRVILSLATTIPDCLEELNLGWKLKDEESVALLTKALDENRLLLVADEQNVSVSVPTGQTLAIRNHWMRTVGQHFVVASMGESNYLRRLMLGCYEMLVLCSQPASQMVKTAGNRQEETTEETAAQTNAALEKHRHEDLQLGWDIYRLLKKQSATMPMPQLRQLLMQYLQLDIERPSLLHSLILTLVAKHVAGREDFNFTSFFKLWSIDSLRPEDWRGQKYEGRFLPSLADRCLARLIKNLPSRNLLSTDYGRPYDISVVHLLLDAAMQRHPKNQKHLSQALRLAYYEHDTNAIAYYKQRLNIA